MEGPPFFVVGSARSGTTLLRVILNAHSQVAVPPESRFVMALWTGASEVDTDDFLARLAAHRQYRGWDLEVDAIRAELGDARRVPYTRAVEAAYTTYAKKLGKKRWGDKTPRYVMHLPFLSNLFPEARFVHLVRDGRNVALSYAKVPFGPKTAPKAAALWAERVTTGVREGRPLGNHRYIELPYEGFVESPEEELKRLCDFLELEFEASMLDYTEMGEKVLFEKASTFNPHVFEKPTPGVRSWETEMPARQVKLFEAVAGEALDLFGYPRRYPALSPVTKLAASLGRMGVPLGRLTKED